MNRFFALAASVVTVGGGVAAQATTISYYRFEGTPDTQVAAGAGTVEDSQAPDNDLSVFAAGNAFTYSSDVPVSPIPQTGQPNNTSGDFDGRNDDAFGQVGGPFTAGADDFTIEAYVNFDTVTGFRTFVGRDDQFGNSNGVSEGPASLFYFQKTGANQFRVLAAIEDGTADGGFIEAAGGAVVANQWYHVAAVGDTSADTLSLYVDGTLLTATPGYTSLFDPTSFTGDFDWTLGRGQFNGGIGDYVDGHIDEVRFSDSALAPGEFLNAVPEPASLTLLLAGGLGLAARRRRA